MKKITTIFSLLMAFAVFTMSCEGDQGIPGINGQDGQDGADGSDGMDGQDFANMEVDIDTVQFTSITPALIQAGPGAPSGVTITPLFSSEDALPLASDFIFGGSADGAGFLKNGEQYEYFVNNEDNYAVSKIILNASMTPVWGEYVLNSSGAGTRLCSGSLIDPEVNGFGPLFLAAGESGIESQVQAVDVATANGSSAGIPRPVPAFGRWNSENAIALPSAAFNDTNIIIGDDHSSGAFGQIVMYRASRVGDLVGGSVYVLRRTDLNTTEMDMDEGVSYDVEFVEIPNAKTMSGAQLDQASADLNAIAFGRVEDVDYRKGSDLSVAGREVWFAVTGDDEDPSTYSVSGRIYKLNLDDGDAFNGTLVPVIDGDADGNGSEFHNPDNIMVTENFVYVQEDPNGYNRTGGSVVNGSDHPAQIYAYDIANNTISVVVQTLEGVAGAPYTEAGDANGSWEYGAMLDITDEIGASVSTFILAVQPHTWREDKFAGADGGAIRPNENQGSQIVIIEGLPR